MSFQRLPCRGSVAGARVCGEGNVEAGEDFKQGPWVEMLNDLDL